VDRAAPPAQRLGRPGPAAHSSPKHRSTDQIDSPASETQTHT
jgi:hypothetical protein